MPHCFESSCFEPSYVHFEYLALFSANIIPRPQPRPVRLVAAIALSGRKREVHLPSLSAGRSFSPCRGSLGSASSPLTRRQLQPPGRRRQPQQPAPLQPALLLWTTRPQPPRCPGSGVRGLSFLGAARGVAFFRGVPFLLLGLLASLTAFFGVGGVRPLVVAAGGMMLGSVVLRGWHAPRAN